MYQPRHMRPRRRPVQHLTVTVGVLLMGIGIGGVVALQSVPR